jgi:hypothetical protein
MLFNFLFNQIRFVSRSFHSSISFFKDSNLSIQSNSTGSVSTIDPWFLTGFTDGDGCFSFSVLKATNYK